MLTLDDRQTRDVLPYGPTVDAIEVVIRDSLAGRAQAPPRYHLPLPESGVFLVMPATDEQLAITKLVTVHPHNQAHGLPRIQGDVLVLDARTGRRLAALNGAAVTAVRTAAVSALAARKLAFAPGSDLLLIGAGVQAASHLQCFAEVFGTRRAYACSRSPERLDALCVLGSQLGVEMKKVDDCRTVLDQVRMIVTCTNSNTPVLPSDLAPGTFVAAVGAYSPAMSEIPNDLIRRACEGGRFIIDSPAAKHEAGEIVLSAVAAAEIPSLFELNNQLPSASEITIFKSVGHALWDLAASRIAIERLGANRDK